MQKNHGPDILSDLKGWYKDLAQCRVSPHFDERPDDGVFTADLKLLQPAGMYLLQVNIDNPVFARQYQQYVTILPKPIKKWFVQISNSK